MLQLACCEAWRTTGGAVGDGCSAQLAGNSSPPAHLIQLLMLFVIDQVLVPAGSNGITNRKPVGNGARRSGASLVPTWLPNLGSASACLRRCSAAMAPSSRPSPRYTALHSQRRPCQRIQTPERTECPWPLPLPQIHLPPPLQMLLPLQSEALLPWLRLAWGRLLLQAG